MAETNTTVEVVKAIVPIGTFALGYAASQFDKKREARQKLRNMRSILFKEMLENYRLLNKVIPSQPEVTGNPALTAQILPSLSAFVYREYLGRLDNLKPEELDKVYDVYSSLEQGIKNTNEYILGLSRQEGRNLITAKAVGMVLMAEKLHADLTSALQAFPDGEKEIKSLEHERGEGLVTLETFSRELPKEDAEEHVRHEG
jgi:hypothetical protein